MANNAQVAVNLKFSTDAKAAKAEIDSLQKSLSSVMQVTSRNAVGNKFTAELQQASAAAAQLKAHIHEAFNENTGKLDLSRFNQSLKESGMTITQYKNALAQAGPIGQQAFNQLAMSITTAEIPLIRISTKLQKLGTTLANTVRWQLSSGLLMGFTGAISEAYNYAQDLNESLNNIRIVTGYNIEQMDKFAASATKAAKALSTTTTKYTDASLIYFQQGLNDKQVQERTDLTIKMANVTGESVSTVSDQLTAVWNNFDNGTKSLEHYVDVMVALGAATASSTDEISEGLNKFASVAETVGLSYEYAAAALATVTATTRQSADVVGTAFKTLFARIQDLELGKTLEDGTSLGQYSQALASIGINIKDSKGQIKDMNDILDEMGAKWDGLNKAQQIALAQNVAGVRQYTQLIALMDNWDYFQENLSTAATSAGALTEQADIYAESWRAARDRVTASLEDIYNKILEDDAFIAILDGFSDLIDGVSNTIDALGGLKGVLITLGTVLTKVFSQQIAQGMTNLHYSLMSMTKTGRQQLVELQRETSQAMASSYGTKGASALEGKAVASMAEAQMSYTDIADKLNEKQKAIAQSMLEQQRGLAQAAIEEANLAKASERTLTIYKNRMKFAGSLDDERAAALEKEKTRAYSEQLMADVGITDTHFFDKLHQESETLTFEGAKAAITELKGRLDSLGVSASELSPEFAKMINGSAEVQQAFKNYAGAVEKVSTALNGGKVSQEELRQLLEELTTAENQLQTEIAQTNSNLDSNDANFIQAAQAAREYGRAMGSAATRTSEAVNNAKNLPAALKQSTKIVRSASQDIVAFAQGLGSVVMAVNTLLGIFDVLNNEDMTFWDKLLSITTSLTMVIPMLISGIKTLTTIELANTLGKIANAAATWGQAAAENAHQKEMGESTAEKLGQTAQEGINTGFKGFNKLKNAWNQGALKGQLNGKNALVDGDYALIENADGSLTEITAQQAGKAALKNVGTKLAGGLATAAVVAVALAAAKAIYDAADEAYNRDEYAAQKAEKAAQELAKAYGKVADKYNELDTASKNYSEGIKSLDELTKGTVEYQEQISKTNEEALKLINTYDELAGQYHTTAEGLIVFNEGALENIKLLELQRKNTAATAATIANQEAREARAQANTTKFLREDIDSKNTVTTEDGAIIGKGTGIGLAGGAIAGGTVLASTLAGTKIGTALGNVIPVPGVGAIIGAIAGTVIGASIGLVGAAIDKNEAAKNEKKSIEALSEAYNKIGNAALTPDNMKSILETKGITDPKLIESLGKNSEELEKLLIEIKANTEARRLENINLARERYASTDKTFTDYNNSIQTAISTIAGTADTKKSDEIDYGKKDYAFGGWYTLGTYATQEGKDQFKLWAEDQGLTDAKATNFSGNVIKYNYLDEEGVRKEKELTYDQLAAWQEGQEISQASLENYDKIRDTVVEISQLKGGEGLLNVLGGQDVNNLTLQQIQDLKAAYESGEFNDELTEMGKLNGEDYAQAVENAINSWDYDTAFANYAKKIQSEIDGILASGASETEYSAQALEDYSLSLLKNSKVLNGNGQILNEWQKTANKKIAAEMAVANAKFAKGLVALNEVMTDSVDILDEWNERSLETWEAVGKIQEALEDTFGVKVSADYVKEHLNEIKQLATGDVSALEELQQAAAKDFIINLDISENAKTNMVSMIDSFISQAEMQAQGIELDVGANLDLASYTDQLNKMLEVGNITADEVKKTFAAIGYAVDIKTTKKEVTNTSQFVMDDPVSGKQWKGSITNTSVMDVPYIAGEGTAQAGQEITTSTGDNVTVGYKEKGTGFTYTGGVDTKAGLAANIQKGSLKNAKRIEDEIDRYHEIKEELSDIENELDAISKAKDRAFGQAKLSLTDQEIAKQNDLIEAEKEYLRQIKEKYNEDLVALDSRFELDDEGRIKNYTKTLEELQKTYGPEKYEELKDAADQYEKTLNELEAQQEAVNDSINEAADLALERIEYSVEIKVHFNDRDIKHFNFLLEKLDDPLQDAAEAIALIGKTAASNLSNIDAYIGGIEEILGQSFSKAFQNLLANMPSAEDLPSALSEILGDAEFTDDQVTALEKYVDSLYDTSGALDDFYTQVMEQVNGAFDNMNEKSEKAISRTEQLGETLQTYQNIIDLVGKKALGVTNEQIRALGRAQIAQAKATLETKQGQLEMNRTALAAAEAKKKAAEESGDGEAVKYWEEQIETIQDKVWTLEGEVETAWSDTLQSIADDFQNAVETATSAFEESMTGIYGSYDKMQEVFDQQKEISDRYVEDYQKIYELSKLNRDLNRSIDETDSVKGKQALRDLQEEINALQESDTQMNEYDLEYLRKKYDLRVAEIALEEAQNAKSQVRMQRDAEGNWGYVYTADEAKVDSAQQSYEDKLYAMQEFNQAYMDEMQNAIIQTEADMLAAIAQLHEEDYASQEEYLKAVDEVRKYYTDKRNYYFSELQKSIGNNKTLYNEDWQSYSENTGYKISKAEDWKDSFEETEYALVTKYPDIETAQRTFTENSKILVQDLTDAYDQWQQDVSDAFDLVGKDFEDFAKEGGELDQRTKEVEEKLEKVTSEFNSWKPTAESAFQGIIDAAEDKFDDFSSEISQYQEKITNVTNALREMLRLAGEKIPDKQLNTDTGGVKGNTNGGSTVSSTTPPKTPTTTTPNYYKTKTYSLKGEKINDRTQEVLEKGAFKFTKEELASAKRSTPWSSYFDIIKDGYTYSIAETDYLQALTESGQSDLYKAAGKNLFTTANTSPDNKPPWGVGDTVTFKKGALTGAPFEFKDKRGQAGDDITYSDVDGYKFTIVYNYDQYGWVGTTNLPINGWPYFYIWKTDLERLDGYDTGGYTGSWDSSGRLAMLHQKEIVLNAHDTENFLAAINIVRDIASAIDLRAAAQQSALSQITAASVSPMTQTLEQEVTIHAEFPNATQRTEIEAAFDTLLNRASQFANRKNK